jgi:nitric oxide synthase oxygenase domain/subunit
VCRCPGRQVWRTLQIEDCRHITTVEAMFEQICKHIKQSTNNGIIIPTISIFPPRKVDKDHLGKQLSFQVIMSYSYFYCGISKMALKGKMSLAKNQHT